MSLLPVYDGLPEPSFVWGKLDGSSATDVIQSCYERLFTGNETSSKFPQARLAISLFESFHGYFMVMLRALPLNQFHFMQLC